MPPTNDFLPFCPTDTGTNLLTESDYTAATDRVSGNKPGIASAKLNNKALRQSTYITSQMAQFLANITGTDVLDDATPAKLLAQFTAALKSYPSIVNLITTSSTFTPTYIFYIATGSATVGATYTNNAVTYTVKATVASGVEIQMSGNGAPTASGTLTKASGTGDATLTFYAVRTAKYFKATAIGAGGGAGSGQAAAGGGAGGGGGGGAYKIISASAMGVSQTVTIGAAGATGSAGGNTTFGAILTANGGAGGGNSGSTSGALGGAGGTASGGDINIPGQKGGTSTHGEAAYVGGGGDGGSSPFGLGIGGRGGPQGDVQNGTVGVGYGAGGGGSSGAGSPAVGTAGVVIVEECFE